ncbi:hypothetical protein D805_0325 [Bifidobacterium thermophilum RBL67]|uniref:Uncharacterized protein n=1 Tax=Bifidobacterium thermophilum RBL67 TaxID=1254439 RepID=M4RPY6_9BIFI|nr:hypothetical protein D805_0325 [Bifidobacterium thermophilum RBL67]
MYRLWLRGHDGGSVIGRAWDIRRVRGIKGRRLVAVAGIRLPCDQQVAPQADTPTGQSGCSRYPAAA